ncbi:hypothetical protein [Flaviaesturariibacter amylovorans]|uniref:PD(D/E)XK endonuclease domain-containing protein n=1 Tax=Flaviaesturariibacter amylovorans TaxID=1084520 RepID=A0ABP8G3J9_9BACT
MKQVLSQLEKWFNEKNFYFLIFSATDTRLEGWFKGEMLVLFAFMKHSKIIADFEVEHSLMTGERVDFKLILPSGEIVFLELKALSISKLKGSRGLSFYMSDSHLFNDFRKLEKEPCSESTKKLAIAFIYPKPNNIKWQEAIAKANTYHPNWQCLSSIPGDELDYFMSVWEWVGFKKTKSTGFSNRIEPSSELKAVG